ncbi:ABC transporter ATP-binding protein [Clostridium sp. YIM B02505]|uniref:ABC transporter ATP-binding protein n=1 Tax=Clostridium yunnanense TaxID=2800325 RepID=A0ABS1EJL0_9CLOT|nr:ABC transporter ATP-binding protein [Clostridium yunnanense]MBK1809546.1 ABC transporter ATP-binding protein [Clostridium yunnanense]
MGIVISNLYKEYKKDVYAIENLSIKIGNGVFGLLGQNGAGKTTLMRIITTLLAPTKGSVELNGIALTKSNEAEIRKQIGYLPQEFGFYPNLTVYECLDYIGLLNKIEPKKRKEDIANILEKVNLQDQKNKRFKNLSGGMKRRVGLAQAMINDPKILVIDEPTTGLDPEERVRIRNMIADFGVDKTVIFSTHIIEDIASTSKNLGILEKGKLLYSGTTKELIESASGKIWSVELNDRKELEEIRKENFIISNVYVNDYIQARVISEGKPYKNAKIVETNIEDAYMYVRKNGGTL